MDLNGDGKIDILSGSYSRHDPDMAGLFQVLWGLGDGGFKAAEVLKGTDGEPLIITATKEDMTDKICTRPTAVDINGDGKLDLVSGNFTGTFVLFLGQGEGRFSPKHSWLTAGNQPLRVDGHSDPFFVDWDGDGDLDLISGSGRGGVFLCTNTGSAQEQEFARPVELVAAVGHRSETRMGDAHLTGPQSATRVWVGDINGDGKLDLLIGDQASLSYPAEGLDEATARAQLAEWAKKQKEVQEAFTPRNGQPTDAEMKKYQEDTERLWKEREKIVRSDATGFVWVLYQK